MKNISCIPILTELDEFLAFSRQYGAAFEYNDFFQPSVLDDAVVTRRIVNAYRDTGRDLSRDTLHGVFLDICVDSIDPLIFKASDLRVRQCMDIARELGLRAVIFHTNYIVNFNLETYRQGWVERNEAYWRGLLSEYQELEVYMENMFDDSPALLVELAQRLAHPRFGICLDVAHAGIFGASMEEWYLAAGPHVRHLHINDNDGLHDLHWAVGTGRMDWSQYNSWCRSQEYAPTVLVEVRSMGDLERSVEFLRREGLYPFPSLEG